MATITIGRVGVTVPLTAPQQMQLTGDELRMSGVTVAATIAAGLALRDQIRGLRDNIDEPVVPIQWPAGYERWDGFYRVDDTTAQLDRGDGKLAVVRWQVTCTRATNSAAPVCESRCVMTHLVNAHSLSTSENRFVRGVPMPASEMELWGLSTSPTLATGDGGSVYQLNSFHPATWSPPYTSSTGVVIQQFTTTLAAWYAGACTISIGGQVVVGRQAPDVPTTWELSNGLVRVVASATAGRWDIQWFNAGAWTTIKTFQPFSYIGNNTTGFLHIGVLRNSPESATIRMGLTMASVAYGVTVDLTIRRGSRWVDVSFVSKQDAQWGVRRTTAEAATAMTGAIRATNADADGLRYLLTGPASPQWDLTNGAFWLTTADYKALFGIGIGDGVGNYNVGESGGTGTPLNTHAQVYRWYGRVAETVTVVGR